jgi:hypothetical protein
MAIVNYSTGHFDPPVALDMTKGSSQIAILALENYARMTEFPAAGISFTDASSVVHANLTRDEIINIAHAVRVSAAITVATAI